MSGMNADDAKRASYSTMVPNTLKREWPSQADTVMAQNNDYTYGDKADTVLGKAGRIKIVPDTKTALREINREMGPKFDQTTSPISGEQRDALYAAKLAADKSPVAALGFDLSKVQYSPKGSVKPLTIAGAYFPDADEIWSDGKFKSNPVHESIHRGLEQLRKVHGSEEVDKVIGKYDEEFVVRAMMLKHFGDVEITGNKGGDQQVMEGNQFLKDHGDIIDKLEKMSQDEIAKRKPRGPR